MSGDVKEKAKIAFLKAKQLLKAKKAAKNLKLQNNKNEVKEESLEFNPINKNSEDKCYYCGKDFESHTSICSEDTINASKFPNCSTSAQDIYYTTENKTNPDLVIGDETGLQLSEIKEDPEIDNENSLLENIKSDLLLEDIGFSIPEISLKSESSNLEETNCKICRKILKVPSDVNIKEIVCMTCYKANNNANVQNEFYCENCRKSFADFDTIQKHIVAVHEGKKCDFCNWVYTESHALQTHIQNDHKECMLASVSGLSKSDLANSVPNQRQEGKSYLQYTSKDILDAIEEIKNGMYIFKRILKFASLRNC